MKNFYLRIFILVLFFCVPTSSFCQNQKLADSLILVYDSKSSNLGELELLRMIIEEVPDPEKSLEYSELLILKSEEVGSSNYLCDGHNAAGNALKNLGDYSQALSSYFTALEIANELKDDDRIGSLSIAIASIYSDMGDTNNSSKYFNIGIKYLRVVNDSIKLGTALLNAGDDYFMNDKLDSAKILTEESGHIFKLINNKIGYAYYLGNIGLIYAKLKNDSIALINITKASKTLEELGDYYPVSVYLTYMSDIYKNHQNWNKAFEFAQKSLTLAIEYDLKPQISDAYLKLSELYEVVGNRDEAYSSYKNHIIYRDSVNNIKTVQDIANIRTDYEIAQKQVEVNLKQNEVDLLSEKQRNQRITIMASLTGLGLILVLTVGLFRRNRFIQKTSNIIQEEKNRSDNLLLNILPEETAKELKEKGSVKAKKFDSVTVLFTDFIGFTKYSANLSPEQLVKSVNQYYSKFDEIMVKHGLEKIKTIGDAYMAAGGLPFPSENHAIKMIEAAIEIAEFVRDFKETEFDDQPKLGIRIGINTGAVVAGVVGTKKFAYDVWGDTVNIASRMESNSEAGKINISDSTYQLVKERFSCVYRGEIEAKNKGKLKMYFVENF